LISFVLIHFGDEIGLGAASSQGEHITFPSLSDAPNSRWLYT